MLGERGDTRNERPDCFPIITRALAQWSRCVWKPNNKSFAAETNPFDDKKKGRRLFVDGKKAAAAEYYRTQ